VLSITEVIKPLIPLQSAFGIISLPCTTFLRILKQARIDATAMCTISTDTSMAAEAKSKITWIFTITLLCGQAEEASRVEG